MHCAAQLPDRHHERVCKQGRPSVPAHAAVDSSTPFRQSAAPPPPAHSFFFPSPRFWNLPKACLRSPHEKSSRRQDSGPPSSALPPAEVSEQSGQDYAPRSHRNMGPMKKAFSPFLTHPSESWPPAFGTTLQQRRQAASKQSSTKVSARRRCFVAAAFQSMPRERTHDLS